MASLIDSDYDEDDEELNSEMDEIFSLSPHHSDDCCDRNDDDSDHDSDDDFIDNDTKNFIGNSIRYTNSNIPTSSRNADQLFEFYN